MHDRAARRFLLVALTLTHALVAAVGAEPASQQQLSAVVAEVRRADYEGDRRALEELAQRLAAMTVAEDLVPAKGYWRGFAYWRRALNGFNDGVAGDALEADLRSAIDAFEGAFDDPRFTADAKSGAAACWISLAFIKQQQVADLDWSEWADRYIPLLRDAMSAEPDNPRVAWVWGAQLFYTPEEAGGGQEEALALFVEALAEAARERIATDACTPSLEPSWGLPELLMNLAYFELQRPEPNVGAAEAWARSALALVPHWRYVRDILLPQILGQREGT